MKNIEFDKFRQSVIDYGEIYKEYIESMELWKDVTKYLEELRDKYRNCPTFSLEKEIKEWEAQERDYFNLFNEYQQEMINKGFDYDYDEKVEFLELYNLFEKLTNEIKLIENKSKKFGSKKEIGTNRVETYNAEGRKKYIHEYLLNDYNFLVNQKKQILPRYKELYKKYIDFDVISVDSNVISNEDIVIFDIDEGFELEKKYFNQMTIDEKIDYYKKRINSIINAKNTGKKNYITVYGDKYYVPEKYEYLVRDYLKEIKKLNDSKQNISEEKEVNSDINVADEIICSDNDENYDEILSFIDEKNVDNNDSNFVMSDVADVYSVDNMKLIDVQFSDVTESFDDRDIWSDSSLVPVSNPKNTEEVKPSSIISVSKQEELPKKAEIITIKKVKKPRSKFNLRKAVAAVAAAVAIAVTGVISAFGIASLDNKNTNDDVDVNTNSSNYEDLGIKLPIDDLHDKITQRNNLSQEDNIIDNKAEIIDSVKDDVKVKIGDIVNIKKNSYIYNNVYDAMNQTNGLNPYFDSDIDRNVTGFFINCDNTFIYTENQNDANKLVDDGGVIESVVVGKYEGAYNYNDIKSKVKVR